jgi:hypothetical protein
MGQVRLQLLLFGSARAAFEFRIAMWAQLVHNSVQVRASAVQHVMHARRPKLR